MKVQLIARQGKNALVSYVNDAKEIRVTVPFSKIVNEEVEIEVLKKGIPFGFPWHEVVIERFDSEKFEAEMYQRGLWTVDEALRHPDRVQSALIATYGKDVADILSISRQRKGEI